MHQLTLKLLSMGAKAESSCQLDISCLSKLVKTNCMHLQSGFAEVTRCLSQLSSTVSGARCLALAAAGSPRHSPRHCANAELDRLHTEVALLKVHVCCHFLVNRTRCNMKTVEDVSSWSRLTFPSLCHNSDAHDHCLSSTIRF